MHEIEIICRSPGMRRCGIEHPARKTYPADRWSEEELARFEADPMFEVRVPELNAENYVTALTSAKERGPLAVAPGATEADRVTDNGAGPTEPHLDATPGSGTGPDAVPTGAEAAAGGATPPETDRIAAIRGVLGELGDDEKTQAGRPKVAALEAKLGFKPTSEEVDEAMKPAETA